MKRIAVGIMKVSQDNAWIFTDLTREEKPIMLAIFVSIIPFIISSLDKWIARRIIPEKTETVEKYLRKLRIWIFK